MFCPAIVAREVASPDKVELGCDLERHIAERLADGLDPLRECVYLGRVTASELMMAGHIGRHPSKSPLIVERPGQAFGFPEIPLDSPEFGQREERVSQVEGDIDSLFPRRAGLGEIGQRRQRLLEGRPRLVGGRGDPGVGVGRVAPVQMRPRPSSSTTCGWA